MTTQEKLSAIREACVAANSELVPDCKAVSGKLSRDIRFADILLAIRAIPDQKWGRGWARFPDDELAELVWIKWNLLNDSLDWHAIHKPETIDFLFDVLNPTTSV